METNRHVFRPISDLNVERKKRRTQKGRGQTSCAFNPTHNPPSLREITINLLIELRRKLEKRKPATVIHLFGERSKTRPKNYSPNA